MKGMDDNVLLGKSDIWCNTVQYFMAVDKVIADQAKFVESYRSGNEKALNALVGQVMKATGGKANPAQVSEILRRKLAAG